jgi:AcrR family transcriptional regulator
MIAGTHPEPRLNQPARRARSKQRLLRAALELVSEQGYERTTLAAIGQRAGYSRGVVSHFFGSKEGLLTELVERMMARWGRDSLEPAVGDTSGTDAMCAAIDAVLDQTRAHPDEVRAFYALLFEALGPLPALRPTFAELHERLRKRIRYSIEQGIENGNVRPDIDASAQAMLFLAVLRGVVYQWLLDPQNIELAPALEEQKRNLLRTLRSADV